MISTAWSSRSITKKTGCRWLCRSWGVRRPWNWISRKSRKVEVFLARRRLNTGSCPLKAALAPTGVLDGEESHRLYQAADPCGPGQPLTARRSRIRPAGREHHGVLQSLQCADPGLGKRLADPSSDYRIQRSQFHLHHE